MQMKRLSLLCAALMLVAVIGSASTAARKKRPKPNPPTTVEIITQVNDYWQQHHSPKVRSFWDEAAYHTGNM